MELNRLAPFWMEGVGGAGVGGAVIRMNAAKLTRSDDISETVPRVVPKLGLPDVPLIMTLASSGELLNTQPATALRSLGNSSFETPCSTLYASPTNMSTDLFWAFQPKRVMVPSLPLVLNTPPILRAERADAVEARFACNTESGVASTSPRPNSGVGMRKITLLAASAALKSGCASVHPDASERPVMV